VAAAAAAAAAATRLVLKGLGFLPLVDEGGESGPCFLLHRKKACAIVEINLFDSLSIVWTKTIDIDIDIDSSMIEKTYITLTQYLCSLDIFFEGDTCLKPI
jgi:hypothetical protein